MEPITITALGTTWWIEIFSTIETKRRDELTQSITSLLLSIENRFSRFRDDSLIGTLNRERSVVTEDADLAELIAYGRTMFQKTNGSFNILVGDALVARGYDNTYSLVEMERAVEIGNPLVDLDYKNHTWRLNIGQIDLGGIGKGWAIDKIAALLTSHEIKEFLINGGGDMYGTSDQQQPIVVYLEHPTEPGTFLGTTTIHHQGFAASSSRKRRWKTKNGERSHIIGDKKQLDASFVIAADAITADTLATTTLLLSPEEFAALADSYTASYATYTAKSGLLTHSERFPFIAL